MRILPGARISILRASPGLSGTDGLKRRGSAQPSPPEKRASQDQADADELHQRDGAVEQHRAAGIAAKKFDGAAFDTIQDEIGADHLSRKALALAEPDEN